MDSVGEGEGGKIWENGIETCVISCMKQKKKEEAKRGKKKQTKSIILVKLKKKTEGNNRETKYNEKQVIKRIESSQIRKNIYPN